MFETMFTVKSAEHCSNSHIMLSIILQYEKINKKKRQACYSV